MTAAPASTPKPRCRWFYLTPDRLIFGLLLIEGFLLLSEQMQWFAFNERKGLTLVFAVAACCMVLCILLLWFIAALLFRRRYQYGIRSLLVLTIVIAVLCSWCTVEMNQARKQRNAVAAIEQIGGRAIYDSPLRRQIHNRPAVISAPEWLRNLLGVDLFDDVEEVDFNYSHVSNEVLANVKGFQKMKWISLYNKQVTDEFLVHFYGLKNLQTVVLRHTSVSKEGERKLKEALPKAQVKREWE